MPPTGSSGGQGTAGQKKKIVNPYASKKPNPYAKKPANNNPPKKAPPKKPPPPPNAAPPLPKRQVFDGSSFSQAFGSIEDTEFYKKSSDRPQETNGITDTDRAQQRAIDALTDRDHHLMIQPHVLSVSTKQRGNGVLNYIRNVPFSYARMVPDYVMSTTTCALFLSCKYHSLHPTYIHKRIAELKTDFSLRILLLLVDVDDNQATLLFLNKLAVVQNMTLILAWTEEEAARYLESFKALKDNDASLIKRKEKTNFVEQATEFLSGASGVNKTDSASLLTQFTSIKAVMAASQDELGLVHGLGKKKVQRLHDAFHLPFSTKRKRERQQQQQQEAAQAKLLKATTIAEKEESKDKEENSDEASKKPKTKV